MKKGLMFFGGLAGILFLAVAGYVIYMLVSYHRIEDNQELVVEPPLTEGEAQEAGITQSAGEIQETDSTQPSGETQTAEGVLQTGVEYSAVTYNIGFGAYTPAFSFFMDGGTSSWAESRESVVDTVSGAAALTASLNPDFALLQEIDLNSTRSYHVNEYDLIREEFQDYYSVFAVNYDSAFLMYPFTRPHGKSHAGMALLSRYPITSALRRSFPIAESLNKFLDLDRCYSISRVPVDNGQELVIITLHMSAYGNSDEVREGQIQMLCEDMEREYASGNYVICGGDFNHDLKSLEDAENSLESWAYPFPRESLPGHFAFGMDLLPEEERQALWNSSRNADMEYIPETTYTITLDGFILSDNVELEFYENVNTGYAYSDHEPVYIRFRLK